MEAESCLLMSARGRSSYYVCNVSDRDQLPCCAPMVGFLGRPTGKVTYLLCGDDDDKKNTYDMVRSTTTIFQTFRTIQIST